MEHRNGAISTTASSLDCAGPNTAVIYGTKARIEIASVWYSPTSFRVINYKGEVLEEFVETVAGRGMKFQAFEMERLVRSGTSSEVMSREDTIAIMETLDAIRKQIGLVYPSPPFAVITGGSSGMALATAKLFVDEGTMSTLQARQEVLDEAVTLIDRNVTGVQGEAAPN